MIPAWALCSSGERRPGLGRPLGPQAQSAPGARVSLCPRGGTWRGAQPARHGGGGELLGCAHGYLWNRKMEGGEPPWGVGDLGRQRSRRTGCLWRCRLLLLLALPPAAVRCQRGGEVVWGGQGMG